ncbi:hypothetical protein [Bosea sp. TAF32]|uniref:hypothetical protein n=1 Tax=Bosea sp. TAF32 TaxID=3237482 RepID=UPI003F91ECFF
MKVKAIHHPDQRPSEPNSKFEIESREDYALALDRLKALEAGERSDDEEAEVSALKKAVRAWDRWHDRKLA